MKTLVLYILILLANISCSKDPADNPGPDSSITVSKTTMRLDSAVNTSDTFTIQADVAWKATITPAAPWLELDKTTGAAGNTVVKARILYNNGSTTQTATIKLEAINNDATPVNITVTQKPYGITVGWQKTFGGTLEDGGGSLLKTPDGGYLVSGYTKSNNGDVNGNRGGADLWITRFNSSGTILWDTVYGGTIHEYGGGAVNTSDGGFLIAGRNSSDDGDFTGHKGGGDMVLLKLDGNGHKQWHKTFGGTKNDGGGSILPTSDNGYVIVGTSYSDNGDLTENKGQSDLWILKVNASGDKIWSKTFGGSSYDYGGSIITTPEGGYLIMGYTESSNSGDIPANKGESDIWVLKLDGNGNKIWSKTYGGTKLEDGGSVVRGSDGGYIFSAQTRSTDGDIKVNHHGADLWIVKIDDEGAILWQQAYGGTGVEFAGHMIVTSDGGYAIATHTGSKDGDVVGNHGGADMWLVKLTATGTKQWARAFGGTLFDSGGSISATENGYVYLGLVESNNGDISSSYGIGDLWLGQIIVIN